MGLDIPAWDS